MALPLLPIAMAVGATGNLLSTIGTNRSNLDLARESYANQLDMWNKQNDYNSPENQMKRYQQAGLNPNLIYSQGSAGNTATSSPVFNPPRNQAPQAEVNNLLLALEAKQRMAQIQNIEASTANTNMRTVTEGLLQKLKGTATERAIFDLDQERHLAPYNQTIRGNLATQSANKIDLMLQSLANQKLIGQKYSTDIDLDKARTLDVLKSLQQRDLTIDQLRFGNSLRKYGVTEQDNVFLRGLLRAFDMFKNNSIFDFLKK